MEIKLFNLLELSVLFILSITSGVVAVPSGDIGLKIKVTDEDKKVDGFLISGRASGLDGESELEFVNLDFNYESFFYLILFLVLLGAFLS